MSDEIHVVVGTESGKLIAGHDKKMTLEQAQARSEKFNKDAEAMDLKTRSEARTLTPAGFAGLK